MNNNLVDIYKYFGNEAFVRANAGRVFTPDEMIIIIINSREVAIEDKVHDITTLRQQVNQPTQRLIDKYINYLLKNLAYIRNTEGTPLAFTIMREGNDSEETYTSLDEAVRASGERGRGYINEVGNQEYKQEFYVKNGTVTDICLDILDTIDFAELGADIVRLNTPFKPFDVVNVGKERFVIAESDGNAPSELEYLGWIDVDMPVYRVAEDGSLYVEWLDLYRHELSEVYRVESECMTEDDIDMLEYVKAHTN